MNEDKFSQKIVRHTNWFGYLVTILLISIAAIIVFILNGLNSYLYYIVPLILFYISSILLARHHEFKIANQFYSDLIFGISELPHLHAKIRENGLFYFCNVEVPDNLDENNYFIPPWVKHQNVYRDSSVWRQGNAEEYLSDFYKWFDELPNIDKEKYKELYPEPPDYLNFYNDFNQNQ